MKTNIIIFSVLAVGIMLLSCDSTGDRQILGKDKAKVYLQKALVDSTSRRSNVIYVPDEATAIKVAEVVVFKLFGEDKIRDERPYEIYLVDGYWVIKGTLPLGADGGTFDIVINSYDGRIVRLGHER